MGASAERWRTARGNSDISPAEPLRQLHLALRRAIHAVRGPDSTKFKVPKAHVSLAYATGTANSYDYQSKLRQVDPNSAPLRLEEVQLVELSMDHRARQVWWTTVESLAWSRTDTDLVDGVPGWRPGAVKHGPALR